MRPKWETAGKNLAAAFRVARALGHDAENYDNPARPGEVALRCRRCGAVGRITLEPLVPFFGPAVLVECEEWRRRNE